MADRYENPGPLQFTGPTELSDAVTNTLTLESFKYMHDIKKLGVAITNIQQACRYGYSHIHTFMSYIIIMYHVLCIL